MSLIAGAAGVTRAASNVSHLKLVKRIPSRNRNRINSEYLREQTLCAFSAYELLLASDSLGLRAWQARTVHRGWGACAPPQPYPTPRWWALGGAPPVRYLLMLLQFIFIPPIEIRVLQSK